jgi:hypothetical protein
VEYDRGTEPGRKYAAKLRAYYRYRDSGQAARDYDGFPTLLVVTTDARAEHRIAEEASRASFVVGTQPLSILTTTTDRIEAAPEGILGPIWRVPGTDIRRYWLPGGPPRGLFGAGHDRVASPRLVWPGAAQPVADRDLVAARSRRAPRDSGGTRHPEHPGVPSEDQAGSSWPIGGSSGMRTPLPDARSHA